MAQFRVEFVRDEAKGKLCAELYYPPESTEPLVRTRPIYRSEEDALLGVVNLFKDAISGGRGSTAAIENPLKAPAKARPADRRSAARTPTRTPRARKAGR
jgi:hypothetical protein